MSILVEKRMSHLIPRDIPIVCWLAVVGATLGTGCGSPTASSDANLTLAAVPLEFVPAQLELHFDSSDGEGSVRDVVCELHNRGATPIQVIDLSGTCVCAVAEPLQHSTIAPGAFEPVKLRVSFPAFGIKTSTVTVRTKPSFDTPTALKVVLHGKPHSIPRLLQVPDEVAIIVDSLNVTTETVFHAQTVEREGEAPWITGVELDDNDHFAATIAADVPEEPGSDGTVRRTYRVTIRSLVNGEVNSRRAALRFASNRPHHGESLTDRPVWVRQKHLPRYRLTPEVVSIQKDQGTDTPVRRRVFIFSNRGTVDFAVQTLSQPNWCRVERAELSTKPLEKVAAFDLVISGLPEEARAQGEGLVQFMVSDDVAADHRLDMRIHVSRN